MEIKSFLQYIQLEKRYSPHTVTAYAGDLEQFFIYIKNQYNLISFADVNYSIIRSWLVELIENKADSRSVRRKLTTLRSFSRFLLKRELISQDPTLKIQAPKLSRKLPVFLENEKFNSYLDTIDLPSGFTETRDRLIIEIFYGTGMRLSELISIKEYDVDLHACTVKVLGKRNKERIIPFTLQMRSLIERYQSLKTIENTEEYFFVTGKGRKLNSKFVYRLVKEHLSHVTTELKKSPHVLRHTFATHMLDNGADINSIKDLLGHSSLAATEIYTHNSIEKLKNIYKQAHPRA